MVDIFVGAEQRRFHLHRDLLCNRSVYFKGCFEGDFEDAQQQELFLPEVDVESFDLLVRWLYGSPLKKISSDDDLLAYFALTTLADNLFLERLHNETMNHILEFYRLAPPKLDAKSIRSIYPKTLTGDPLRRLVIQFAAWAAVLDEDTDFDRNNQDLLEGGGKIAVDFTTWLARYYAASKENRTAILKVDPRIKSNCSYHQHILTPACSDPSN